MNRFTSKSTLGMLIAVVATVGCNRQEAQPPATPPPTKTQAPSAALPSLAPPPPPSGNVASNVAAPASVVVPGADTAAAQAQAGAASDDEPLGGKGRPLTEQEKSLLNYGIYMFKEEKGRYPKDLNEAVATRYIRRLPQLPAGESLKYDASSGTVTVIKGK